MAMIVAILVAGVVFVAGFAGWYTFWHRRMATAFERVRVRDDRSALVVRRGAEFPGGHEGR
jgi:hypothetical protein